MSQEVGSTLSALWIVVLILLFTHYEQSVSKKPVVASGVTSHIILALSTKIDFQLKIVKVGSMQ